MSHTPSDDEGLREAIERIILSWSSEVTGQPREKLAPDAITLVDRFEALISQKIIEARIDEVNQAISHEINTNEGDATPYAYFADRIATLTTKQDTKEKV